MELFLSRDLDSRISPREVAAVSEFLASEQEVHVMRDHPAHTAVIMGGMWGAKVIQTRHRFKKAFTEMFKNGISYISRLKGGWDQVVGSVIPNHSLCSRWPCRGMCGRGQRNLPLSMTLIRVR